MHPKISIIIPVRNGENYLAEALESALDQTYPNKEIVVVDDGSTDGTREIVERFSVRSLHQDPRGVGAARNRGVTHAAGEYLAFLDHDDLWEKTKLTAQMTLLLEKKSDPLVFAQVRPFLCSTLTEDERRAISVNEAIVPGYISGTLLLSQKRFREIGPFSETGHVGEFIEWYARALDRNLPIAMLQKVALYRRIHRSNMGRKPDLHPKTGYLKTLKLRLDQKKRIDLSNL